MWIKSDGGIDVERELRIAGECRDAAGAESGCGLRKRTGVIMPSAWIQTASRLSA